MTLGTGLMTQGIIIVYSQRILASRSIVPDFIHALGSDRLGGIIPLDCLSVAADRGAGGGHAGSAPASAACFTRSATIARAVGWPASASGGCSSSTTSICALLASIAGFVLVGHTNSADLSLAATYLLPSIAAVIIGGTSIFGGRGGYSGSIVGALILTVLDGLLTLLDSPEPIKQILYGAIILALAAAYSRLTES